MTDPYVSVLFSSLVAETIKKYRFSDGSRNITKGLIERQEKEIVALVKKFNIVYKNCHGKTYIAEVCSAPRKRKCDPDDNGDREEVFSSKKRADSEFVGINF